MPKLKRTLKRYYISFLSWMSTSKCVRIAHLNRSLLKISPPDEKEELNRISFVFLKDLLFGLKFNEISIQNRKCKRRLTYTKSFSIRMNGKHCIGSQKIDQPSSLPLF